MFYKEIYLTELNFIILFHLSAEELGIKELVPPYLDPHLQPQDLKTGICFASGGTGYDPLTAKLLVHSILSISFLDLNSIELFKTLKFTVSGSFSLGYA